MCYCTSHSRLRVHCRSQFFNMIDQSTISYITYMYYLLEALSDCFFPTTKLSTCCNLLYNTICFNIWNPSPFRHSPSRDYMVVWVLVPDKLIKGMLVGLCVTGMINKAWAELSTMSKGVHESSVLQLTLYNVQTYICTHTYTRFLQVRQCFHSSSILTSRKLLFFS